MPGEGPLEAAMMPVHARLDALFFAHQQALLDRDAPRALLAFTVFRDTLLHHARDEESQVLPLYVACGGDASDSPSAQFRIEHDKLRRFLAELEPRLESLCTLAVASDRSAADRELLGILDRESWFKNLLVHHDLRERNALYRLLSAECDEERQRAALAAMGRNGA